MDKTFTVFDHLGDNVSSVIQPEPHAGNPTINNNKMDCNGTRDGD